MRFVLLMYADPKETEAMSDAVRDDIVRRHHELGARLGDELIGGEGLELPDETTTLHWNGGDHVENIGPLNSGREQLTAYYVLDVRDLERAREIAHEILDFHVTSIEIRGSHDHV